MKRGGFLKRKTPLRAKANWRHQAAVPIGRNVERSREAHMRDFDGGLDHDTWLRMEPCALAVRGDCTPGPIQAAHLKSRGAGGKWWQAVPLCNGHHRHQESWFASGAPGWLRKMAGELAIRHLNEVLNSWLET